MQDIIAFLITLLIFGFVIWLIVKVVKKLFRGVKYATSKAKDSLVSQEVKKQRELAKKYISECVIAEKISDEQKSNAFLTQSLPLSYRETELKQFIKQLDYDSLTFEHFDKVIDLAYCLNISTDIFEEDIANLSTLMIEKELRAGRFDPNIFETTIPLKREETIYFKAYAGLVGTKTTRQYVSGSRGVNVRIAKGLYYRVGASKGHSESIQQDIHKSDGELIITNKRIVFAGEDHSFEVYSNKIINYLFKESMLVINVSNRQDPHRVIVPNNLVGCFDAAIELSIKANNA